MLRSLDRLIATVWRRQPKVGAGSRGSVPVARWPPIHGKGGPPSPSPPPALGGPWQESRGTVLTLDNPGSTPSRRRRGWASSPWERAARHAPTAAARLVLGWAAQHQEELAPAGRAPRADPQSLVPIPPLRSRVPGRDRPHPRVAFRSVGGRGRVAPGITCDTIDPWRG